jgi:ADP-ribosyl-[dinitrogen reductase] hydrolase
MQDQEGILHAVEPQGCGEALIASPRTPTVDRPPRERKRSHRKAQEALGDLAASMHLEKGVTGYINHTVPVALFCWLRWPGDFRCALEEVILLGGDADTTGAIVGALAGATVGRLGIPSDWLSGIVEWPRSVHWIGKLAERLVQTIQAPATVPRQKPISLAWPAVLFRNLFFLLIVLVHGFRRLVPPYI